jgi:hypothetical protein
MIGRLFSDPLQHWRVREKNGAVRVTIAGLKIVRRGAHSVDCRRTL